MLAKCAKGDCSALRAPTYKHKEPPAEESPSNGSSLYNYDLRTRSRTTSADPVYGLLFIILLSYRSDTHGFRALLLFLPPWRELR